MPTRNDIILDEKVYWPAPKIVRSLRRGQHLSCLAEYPKEEQPGNRGNGGYAQRYQPGKSLTDRKLRQGELGVVPLLPQLCPRQITGFQIGQKTLQVIGWLASLPIAIV